MQKLELQVDLREARGKGAARKLRANCSIPVIVYGFGSETVSLAVDERALSALMRHGTNQIIDLKGPKGFETRLVLLKESQRDPVTSRVLHCDFYVVNTEQKIDVPVPIRVVGKAKGVEMGGILDVVLREIQVKCLPLAIPDILTIDVSALEVGDARHVSDLEIPPGVELVSEPSQTLVHVVAPRVEEEEVSEEEAAEAAADEAAPEGETAPAAAEAPKAEEGAGE